jgi:hypothetical protein
MQSGTGENWREPCGQTEPESEPMTFVEFMERILELIDHKLPREEESAGPAYAALESRCSD